MKTRWPTRIFYEMTGELSHPYTRMRTPNLKLMSCYYRCKSYRTFGCDAKLKLTLKGGPTGADEWTLSGHHTEICQNKNGIGAANDTMQEGNQEVSNMRDITELFKNRLTELAVEKIWLAPMKIWSMVRDEMVGAEGGGAPCPSEFLLNREERASVPTGHSRQHPSSHDERLVDDYGSHDSGEQSEETFEIL